MDGTRIHKAPTRTLFLSLLVCRFGALALLQALTSLKSRNSRKVTAQIVLLLDLVDTDLKKKTNEIKEDLKWDWHEYLRSSFQK